MQQMHKKINKCKRIKVVSPGFRILFYLKMQQQTQKKRVFLSQAMEESHRLRLSLIMVASWYNNISTFKYSTVYCNKLRTNEMYNSQKHLNNPHLPPKMIGLKKKSVHYDYLC